MAAYEAMIRNTATQRAPWYVVPADNKWFTRVIVAAAIIDALASLDLAYPEVDEAKLPGARRRQEHAGDTGNQTGIAECGVLKGRSSERIIRPKPDRRSWLGRERFLLRCGQPELGAVIECKNSNRIGRRGADLLRSRICAT